MPLHLHHRVIAHHLIFSSYGFWLANDPRGSNSTHIRHPKFEPLAPLHPGRKKDQPTRASLRAFYEQATPLLNHSPLWFNETIRTTIAHSFQKTTKLHNYTLWSFAILSNHAHLCLRQHRDHRDKIWTHYAHNSRDTVIPATDLAPTHPLWADRPYSVFLYTHEDIRRTIAYIENNPIKENLPPQNYPWISPYTGWPQKPPTKSQTPLH